MTCEEFEALVMELVEDEGLSPEFRADAEAHAGLCTGCGALHGVLRETRDMTLLMPLIDPPAVLNERIVNLARAQSIPLSRRALRPMSWAAAASFLFSCGYLLGVATMEPKAEPSLDHDNPGVVVAKMGVIDPGDPSSAIPAEVMGESGSVEISFNLPAIDDPSNEAIKDIHSCRLIQAEMAFDAQKFGEAEQLCRSIREFVDKGLKKDGHFFVDARYRSRLAALERSLAKAKLGSGH